MDPIEQRVRDSLRARAEDVEPTPALYQGVQRRIARRRRRRLAAWVPAGATALAVAVAIPLVLDGGPQVPSIDDYAEQQVASPAAPTRVVTVDRDGEVALLDLTDGTTERPYGQLAGQGLPPEIDVAPEDLADVPTVHTALVEDRTEGPVLSLGYLTAGSSGGGVEVGLDSYPQVTGRFAVSPDGGWTAVLTGPMEDADGWAVQLRPSDASSATAGATQEPGIVVPAGSVIQDWRDDAATGPGRTELTVVTPEGTLVGFPLVRDGGAFSWPDETVAVLGDTVPVVAYASDHLGDDGGFALLADPDGLVVQATVDAEVLGAVDVSDLVADQDPGVLALDAWGHSAVLSSPDGSWLLPQDGAGRFGEPVALPDGTVRAALVGREVTAAAAPAEGDPEAALLAFDDGTLVVVDLVDGAREVLLDDGAVAQIVAAPGGSRDTFRAVAVTTPTGEAARIVTLARDGGGQSSSTATSTLDLPGGSGVAPSVAISTDGRWLAYTGISQEVDAAPAVYVVPIDPADGSLDLTATQEIHTVTVADPDDLIAELVEWTGPVAGEGDVSHLRVRGERQGRLVLERTADGFVVQQRETDGGDLGDAVDVSSGFRAADDEVFVLDRGDQDRPRLRFGQGEVELDLPGVDELAMDARGGTALVLADGAATLVRFGGEGGTEVTQPVDDRVVAGALLGGGAPDGGTTTVPVEEVDEPDPVLTGLPPVVVADERTVTLALPDGTTRELVTFPTEGESTVVSLAVRPGSTPDDLTVALVTRAEGSFDVRYLQVAGGEVVPDPAGVGFPAPPIATGLPQGVGAFPLSAPDLQDGGELGAAWSPGGDLLAVAYRSTAGGAVQVSTIGWDANGPSGAPNLAATFELDTDLPLTLRRWTWTDAGDGATATGELLLVDQLDRRGYRARLDRQGDGAPAMPASSTVEAVDRDGVLDLADTDGDGTVDTVLLDRSPAPLLEWRSSEDGERVDGAEVEAATGPRQLGRIVPLGDRVLVILDPARPQLVDLATMEVASAPLDGEVVAADVVR